MALKKFKEQIAEALVNLTAVERADALTFMQQYIAEIESKKSANISKLVIEKKVDIDDDKFLESGLEAKLAENVNKEKKKSKRKQLVTRKVKGEIDNETEVLSDMECGDVKVNAVKTTDLVDGIKNSKYDNILIYKCPACYHEYSLRDELFAHLKTYQKFGISCKKCRAKFPTVIKFWKHNSSGVCKIPKHVCSECGMKFKYRRHFLKHVTGHKDNNCKYCNEQFSTFVAYKTHLKEKHENVKLERDLIPCKFCSLSFSTHYVLYNHYRLKHSRGKFVCLSCGLFLPTKEKYKDHCTMHDSEKNWMCEICGMKFFRKQQHLLHIKLHQTGCYKCLYCNITLTSIHDAYKHKATGHKVSGLEPKFECKICYRKFTRKYSLDQHMTLHTNTELYKCEPCFKTFRTNELLKKHKKTNKHLSTAQVKEPESQFEKIYEDKLICENCGKQYSCKRDLARHLRLHQDQFQCDVCMKIFNCKSNLKKHQTVHDKTDKEFICETCGDSFSSFSLLKNHKLYKHVDVKEIKCNTCSKTFKRQSELNRHNKIHEPSRPFVCYCGRSYKLNSHLKRHQVRFHVKNFVNYNTENVSEILLDNVYTKCTNNDRNILELQVLHPLEHNDVLTSIDDNQVQIYSDNNLNFTTHSSALDMTVIQSHTVVSIAEEVISGFKPDGNSEEMQLVDLSDRMAHDYNVDTDMCKHISSVIIAQDHDTTDTVKYLTSDTNQRVEYLLGDKPFTHEANNIDAFVTTTTSYN